MILRSLDPWLLVVSICHLQNFFFSLMRVREIQQICEVELGIHWVFFYSGAEKPTEKGILKGFPCEYREVWIPKWNRLLEDVTSRLDKGVLVAVALSRGRRGSAKEGPWRSKIWWGNVHHLTTCSSLEWKRLLPWELSRRYFQEEVESVNNTECGRAVW
jgi:hypothetical protein